MFYFCAKEALIKSLTRNSLRGSIGVSPAIWDHPGCSPRLQSALTRHGPMPPGGQATAVALGDWKLEATYVTGISSQCH